MALLRCALVHHTGSMIRFTTSQLGELPDGDEDLLVLLPDGRIVEGHFHPHTQNPYLAGPEIVRYVKNRIGFRETHEAVIEVSDDGIWTLYDSSHNIIDEADEALAAGQGFLASPAARRAIELLAMEAATEYLTEDGYSVDDVSPWCPYDLRCTRKTEVLHVEVKGTQGSEREILLTFGEVEFARGHVDTMALYVLSNVMLTPTGDATGGDGWIWTPWNVDDGRLRTINYRYGTP